MNRQNPYTQRAIERAIRAALAAGLRVTAVLPDGTVLTDSREKGPSRPEPALTGKSALRDAREKLGVH
jgi:hypothetical protein